MFTHRKETLPNGLRVVTVEAPHLHGAMLAVYVRAGSRHETPRTNGVSHFLEHIFFRGCQKFPEGRKLNSRVEDAGGSLNGVTTRDHGYYYTPLHPKHLEVGIETLGAMLAQPLLKEVDIEREVILEEMLDEVDEDGRDIDVDNIAKRSAYGDHPLSLKIAGTTESVKGLTKADLEAHHERFYCASNMVITAAGPIHHAQIMDLAARHFGGLPRGIAAVDTPPPAWPEGPQIVEVEHEESQTEFRLSFPAPPEQHPDFPAYMVLRRVLDDGLSSRLQVNVVDRKGLAYSVHAGFDTYSDGGSFEVDLACVHAKVPAACEELFSTLGELATVHVPDDELERAKVRHRIGLDFSLDSAADLAGWFGGTELFYPPESFEERILKVDAVTAADVKRVAASMFRRKQLLVSVVGHLDRSQRKNFEAIVRESASLPA
jgi:predicted Zn-dependent peptidase